MSHSETQHRVRTAEQQQEAQTLGHSRLCVAATPVSPDRYEHES